MEKSDLEAIQRCRRDRRELLQFLLSSSLIKKVVLPPGAVSLDDIDLEKISVDHVLSCIRKGQTVSIAESLKHFMEEHHLPPIISTGKSDIFYLTTNPKESGPPPARKAPFIEPVAESNFSFEAIPVEPETPPAMAQPEALDYDPPAPVQESTRREKQSVLRVDVSNDSLPVIPPPDGVGLKLELPALKTGLSESDLRETAYEILLASVGAAGGLTSPAKEKVRDEGEKKRAGFRFTRDKSKVSSPQRSSGLSALLEIMRVQLNVSEPVDHLTKEALLQAVVQKRGRRLDSLLIPLELLSLIPRSDFTDSDYALWSKRQLNVLEEGLINCPIARLDGVARMVSDFAALKNKFLSAETLSAESRLKVQQSTLANLRNVAQVLAERPGRTSQPGENVCHWADGYFLNICIYKEFLKASFDYKSPGQFIPEINEIQEMLKSTWRVLGITQTVHEILLVWAQFNQFVLSGEQSLFQSVILYLKRIPLDSQRSARERAYLGAMQALVPTADGPKNLTLLQTILLPIKNWLGDKLRDFYANFPQEAAGSMDEYLTASMAATKLLLREEGKTDIDSTVSKLCEEYITLSANSAFQRLLSSANDRAASEGRNPLSLLADDIRKLLQDSSDSYFPCFLKWNPLTAAIAVSLLHNLYGYHLKPFLDTVTTLTDDVRQVLTSADRLQTYFETLMESVPAKGSPSMEVLIEAMEPYEVSPVSTTLAMRWVNGYLAKMNEWIDRSLQAETWEPASSSQRHGHSVVDVLRIVEEGFEEFFQLSIPIRSNVVRSFTTGVDYCLQRYVQRMIKGLGPKEDLFPNRPMLTRFKKDIASKQSMASSKKDNVKLSDQERFSEIENLTTKKLCVRGNSLQFIAHNLDSLEASVKQQWSQSKSSDNEPKTRRFSDPTRKPAKEDDLTAMFESFRKIVNRAIDRIADFLATKIIFWDLREQLLDNLYKVSVKDSRIVQFMDYLDPVLVELCGVVTDSLRDRVVVALLQSTLDGLLRVLLDGGPTRVFHQSDAEMLEEDLNILKDFFVADGDGLPRKVVDNATATVQQILNLYSLETAVVIESFKNAGEAMAVSGGGNSQTFSPSKGRSATDADTLLRVLCHRADRDASKFLKKYYRLPKSI